MDDKGDEGPRRGERLVKRQAGEGSMHGKVRGR